jgi:thioredoxin 1
MAAVQHVNQNDFMQSVFKSELPVLVDFYADWCGPCRTMAPVLEELADQFEDKLKVFKVNIENNLSFAEQYNIASIPTLIIFKNGQVIKRQVGALSRAELEEMIMAELIIS